MYLGLKEIREKGETGVIETQGGEKGSPGPQGAPGAVSGGAVYTRWGRTICPDTNGTILIYEGLAAGSKWDQSGGGATCNYFHITKSPLYMNNGILSFIWNRVLNTSF